MRFSSVYRDRVGRQGASLRRDARVKDGRVPDGGLLSAGAACLVVLFLLSCASSAPPVILQRDRCVIEGSIHVTGDNPDVRKVELIDSTGCVWSLHSRELLFELMHLDALPVRITGTTLDESPGSLDIHVSRYELLPWPELDRYPKIGYLIKEGERMLLITPDEGKRFVVDGPLADSLWHLVGQKIWILSDERGTERFDADGTPMLRMRGMGSLDLPLPATIPSPSDTLRDSGN
ncbi:MAG: hypothetical protein JSV33_09355 [bacterium]|nr:MAG: hypothetical protein JSV33_09355 [bacterium]